MNRYFNVIVLLFSLFGLQLNAVNIEPNEFSLVYVHIGEEMPSYLPIAIAQARLFNPICPIYLIVEASVASKYSSLIPEAIFVPMETLIITQTHKSYRKKTKASGFWRYAVERFFFIDDFIQQYHLTNVFHTENDVMLYFDLSEKLSIFENEYRGMIATVFDCDERCVPSFIYFSDSNCSAQLTNYIFENGLDGKTDMTLLGDFKDKNYKVFCDHLPILVPEYANDYPLTNLCNRTAIRIEPYINHLKEFQLIFDAAALGQFLGGIDPILAPKRSGFVAELSIFLTPYFKFQWKQDEKRRWIPYISYRDAEDPIANLHIHCKDLKSFYSLNTEAFPVPTSFWSSMPLNYNWE